MKIGLFFKFIINMVIALIWLNIVQSLCIEGRELASDCSYPNEGQYSPLLYDWTESSLLIGSFRFYKFLCLPEIRFKLAQR